MIMTARQVLECYWDSTAPIDPVVIAKKAGIAVYESKQMEDRLFGVIRRAPETNEVEIIVNGNHDRHRQRLTIARELGYFFNTEEFEGEIEDDKDILTCNRTPKEIAASRFAADLLMPEYAIKYMLIKNKAKTLAQLADMFDVSRSAMNIRLISLGMV